MNTIGYDVTDEIDGHADNGNFHGEYISLKNRTPLPPDNPKRMASLKKSSVDFINAHAGAGDIARRVNPTTLEAILPRVSEAAYRARYDHDDEATLRAALDTA